MTYYPAPGHQHIKLLVPETPQLRTPSSPPRAVRPNTATVSPLVRHAIAAAFGRKRLTTLSTEQFSIAVRSHIRAKRRLQGFSGRPQMMSYHAKEGGELFGTIYAEGRRYGWAAKLSDGKLVSFKIL